MVTANVSKIKKSVLPNISITLNVLSENLSELAYFLRSSFLGRILQ